MKKILLLGLIAGGLAVSASAHAGGLFSLHVGVPGLSVRIGVPPPPIIVHHHAPVCARPVVVAPPRVCVSPPRVVLPPRRVVLVPPPPVVVYRPHRHYISAPVCY